MTVITAPPLDLSPRLASARPGDFPTPTGREEEWRFTPLDLVSRFLSPIEGAGTLVADEAPHVRMTSAREPAPGEWLPTDLPAAIARDRVSQVVEVSIPADTSVEESVHVRLRGEGADAYGHVRIRIGAHARATVVIEHDAARNTAGAIEVVLADGADLTVLSIIDGPPEAHFLWHWPVSVGRDARFVGGAITLGGRVVRMLPSVTYSGPGGSAELLGGFLAQGEQHLEHRILVEHEAPHCTSRVTYKGALSGAGARTVWIGDVIVRRGAIGTDTYELNRNLLLDDGPRADSVPNLELETGDIASAGHASATGRFDDQQLFYLQSRGIPELLARQLVVRGFFADVLARIPDEEWRADVLGRLARRLGMPDDREVG